MPTDVEMIAEAYVGQILTEANVLTIQRLDDTTVEVDGQRKDITDWMYEVTEGGNAMCKIWTKRRRDKKVGGQVIAHAGDTLEVNGKLGACRKDISGVGSPLGGPKERYDKYGLVTVCVSRDGRFQTRHIATDSIFKVAAGNVVYSIISPEQLSDEL